MPIYTFADTAGETVTKRLSFSEYDAVKAGQKQILDGSGAPLTLVFDPGEVAFVLKDGVSGGWTSKSGKENKYRKARSAEMARREKDHVFKNQLVPNHGGEEAHSWSDVRDHVRSTKGEVAASTYDHLVSKEST